MSDAVKSVKVVAFREDDAWIAQCVDFDICTQGRDLAQARRRMNVALRQEARITKQKNGKEFVGIDRAPDYFAAMYEAASGAQLEGEMDFRIAA